MNLIDVTMALYPWVFGAGLLLGSLLTRLALRKRLRAAEPPTQVSLSELLSPRPAAPAYVRFGRPRIILYDPSAYEEPLRCNGGDECPAPELQAGQAIWEIPLTGSDGNEDDLLPWCLDCVPLATQEARRAVEA